MQCPGARPVSRRNRPSELQTRIDAFRVGQPYVDYVETVVADGCRADATLGPGAGGPLLERDRDVRTHALSAGALRDDTCRCGRGKPSKVARDFAESLCKVYPGSAGPYSPSR